MVTRAWKIYGAEGHRQRESFNESYDYDFSNGDESDLSAWKIQIRPTRMIIPL